VLFKPAKWERVGDALPERCMARGEITRGDLFAVAGDRDADRAMWRLFVASKVWGYGPWGYGPARLAKVARTTPEARMEVLLGKAMEEGAEHGPMAAYHRLRGENPGPVAAKYWGSAFFTKALYAGLRDHDHRRPALILDEVLATKVTQLSDMPHLLYRGNGYNWGFKRYGAYLAWIGQTAEKFKVAPELLEYSLFKM
jgi:8-oxoguanine DNA glycosylase-like protein